MVEPHSIDNHVDVELLAVVMAVLADEPMVRLVRTDLVSGRSAVGLPSIGFDPRAGETLESALRKGVEPISGVGLGHIEQLEAGAHEVARAHQDRSGRRLVIGYLALTHENRIGAASTANAVWHSWYHFFPWEDWRRGRPAVLTNAIEPGLFAWAAAAPDAAEARARRERVCICFGAEGIGWDEEQVAERNELLDLSGVLDKALSFPPSPRQIAGREQLAIERTSLSRTDRLVLAAAMGRLRTKIKSKPLVFDLMPELFTLFELQRAVEAILGPHLHKQNFRRLVEQTGLVEPTNEMKTHTGGRPAKLYRFRHSVVLERLQPGVRVRSARH
jgi:hypothetical protein